MKALDYILKGFLFVFAGFGFSRIIGYVFSIIVARIGTTDYGIFNLINIALEMFLMISVIGLNEGIVRYISFYQGKNDSNSTNKALSTALIVSFVFSIIITVAVFLSSDYIALSMFHNKDFGIILKYTVLILPILNVYRIMVPALRGFKAVKYWMYSNDIWKSLTQFIVGSLLVLLGFGLYGAIAGVVASILVAFGFTIYYLRKTFKFKIVLNFDKEIILFSYPLLFSNFLIIIKDWLSTLLLGYFAGVSNVGIFSVAVLIARLITIMPAALTSLFLPVVTEKHAKNKNIKDVYVITTKWVFLSNIFLTSLIILISRQIIIISFGKSYALAIAPLIILSIGYFIENTLVTSKFVLYMLKKTKLVFIFLLLTTIGNLLLSLWLIPKYNVYGASIATAISMASLGLLYLIYSYRYTKINLFKNYHIKIFLAGVISMLLSYLSGTLIHQKDTIFYLIIISIEFAIIYVGLIFLFKILTKKELGLFKNLSFIKD